MTEKHHSHMNPKKKKMIIGGSFGGVIVLFLVLGFFSLTGSSTKAAFLNVEAGTVQIDTGNGWQNVVGEVSLSVADKVRTLNGKAVVVLYESIMVQLDPDTEISLTELAKEKVKINQNSGSTWNKFLKLTGVQGFEVETPTTVATVRGTEFGVTMDAVIVAEGYVMVRTNDGATVEITAGKKTYIDENGNLVVEDVSPEELADIIRRMGGSLDLMKDLRVRELGKHSFAVGTIKRIKGLTDADISDGFDRIDRGELNDRELVEQAPITVDSADRILAINDEIKEQQNAINELHNMQ